MHARTTLLEIDTVRMGVDDALDVFTDTVLPALREQPGFRGVYVLATADGKAMLLSFWETPEQAAADVGSGWYDEVLAEHMTLFRAPPGRDRYEVRLAEVPADVAAGGR